MTACHNLVQRPVGHQVLLDCNNLETRLLIACFLLTSLLQPCHMQPCHFCIICGVTIVLLKYGKYIEKLKHSAAIQMLIPSTVGLHGLNCLV